MSKTRIKVDGIATVSEAEIQCLRTVRAYIQKFSAAPTFDELAELLDKAKTTVRRTLDRLIKKGLLKRDVTKRRSLALTPAGLMAAKKRIAKKGTV